MKHYPFPKIRQFHQVIKDLKDKACFAGLDADGNPIYDWTKELPTIKFVGRVKLHGTNAAIVFNSDGSYYCQSRENIITEEKDNAGFAHWAHKCGVSGTFPLPFLPEKLDECGVSDPTPTAVYFGEWCGGSIQAGVALNELPRMFVLFGVKVIDPLTQETTWHRLPQFMVENPELGIYNIEMKTKAYEVEVDLNRPDKAIEVMNKMVEEIDKECPFAKTFGVSGHGEGIVFRPEGDNSFQYAFKVKGESHVGKKDNLVGIETDLLTKGKLVNFCKQHNATEFEFEFIQ